MTTTTPLAGLNDIISFFQTDLATLFENGAAKGLQSFFQSFELSGATPTKLSSTEIDVTSGSDTVVFKGAGFNVSDTNLLSGAGLAGLSSFSNLISAINGNGDATLSSMTLEEKGSVVGEITLSSTAITITSGGDKLTIDGSFPTSLTNVAKIYSQLFTSSNTLNFNFNAATSILTNYDVTSVTASVNGTTEASLSITSQGATLTAGDYKFTLTGVLPTNLAQLVAIADKIASGSVTTGFTLTSATVIDTAKNQTIGTINFDNLDIGSILTSSGLSSDVQFSFTDSTADVAANFSTYANAAGAISSITLSDPGDTIDLTWGQFQNGAALLSKIAGAHSISVSGVTGEAYSGFTISYGSNGAISSETYTGQTGPLAPLTITGVSGQSGSIGVDVAGTIDPSLAGQTITLYDGATAIGTTTANGQGDWVASATLTASGAQAISAQINTPALNNGAADKSNSISYTPLTYTETTSSLPIPDVVDASLSFITDTGAAVGTYTTMSGGSGDFVLSTSGAVSDLSSVVPQGSEILGVDSAGDVVFDGEDMSNGGYAYQIAVNGGASGYTVQTLVSPDGSTDESVIGIDDSGNIYGDYWNSQSGGNVYYKESMNGGSPTYSTITVSSNFEFIQGVDGAGDLYGYSFDANGNQIGLVQFANSNGLSQTIEVAGANGTEVTGLSSAGYVWGTYSNDISNQYGSYVEYNGQYTLINVPGADSTTISGISQDGVIYGAYSSYSASTGTSTSGDFIDNNGAFTTIDTQTEVIPPTFITGVDSAGEVVGGYYTVSSYGPVETAFTESKGVYTSLTTLPGTGSGAAISIAGIDAKGDIFGSLSGGMYYDAVGFVDVAGAVQTINLSNGDGGTYVTGLDSAGDIVGETYVFNANTDNNVETGFIQSASGDVTFLNAPEDANGDLASATTVAGVSSNGSLVFGSYLDSSGDAHGYVYNVAKQIFTTIDDPKASSVGNSNGVYATTTEPLFSFGSGLVGESSNGADYFGDYTDASGVEHGFEYVAVTGVTSDITAEINSKAASETDITNVASNGDLVGWADVGGVDYGFVEANGAFTAYQMSAVTGNAELWTETSNGSLLGYAGGSEIATFAPSDTTVSPPVVNIPNSGGLTNKASQTISGTVTVTDAAATVGAVVTLYDNAIEIGTAKVGSNGAWSETVTLSSGVNDITVSNTSSDGQTGSNSVTYTLDTIKPTVAITSSGAVDSVATTITGTVADANGVASVEIYEGAKALGPATLNNNGTWTAAVTLINASGKNSITAVATDDAGNTQTSAAAILTVVTTPPTVTISTKGKLINQASLSLSGSVSVASGDTAGPTVTINDNGSEIGTATVGAKGAWSATVTLAEGANALTASDTDVLGTTGTSSSDTFTLITAAPTVTLSTPTQTTAGKTILSGSVSVETGDTPGATVAIYDGATKIATAKVGANGAWSTTVALVAGLHVLTAENTDGAGNLGVSAMVPYDLPSTVAYYEKHTTTLDGQGVSITITDTAAAIAADFTQLNGDTQIDLIVVTNGGALALTVAQLTTDATALGELHGDYSFALTGAANDFLTLIDAASPIVAEITSATITGANTVGSASDAEILANLTKVKLAKGATLVLSDSADNLVESGNSDGLALATSVTVTAGTYFESLADSLILADKKGLTLATGASLTVVDSGVELQTLTAANIQNLAKLGVTQIEDTDPSTNLSLTKVQTQALQKAGIFVTAPDATSPLAINETFSDGSVDVLTFNGADSSSESLYTKSGYGALPSSFASATSVTDSGGSLTLNASSLTVSESAKGLSVTNGLDTSWIEPLTSSSAETMTIGSGGKDIFAFTTGFGTDQITGFVAGSASGHDILQLSKADFAASYSLLTIAPGTGGGAEITDKAGDTITLLGVNASSLVKSDFKFV